MTIFEAIIVVAVLALLAAIFLPALISHHPHRHRIDCVNNLKQVGLAYRIWAGDNNDKYPMEVSVTQGGTMELLNTPDAWKTFQLMSNELSTPKILACPDALAYDLAATNFSDDLKNKISYFIGQDATPTNPAALLSGDDNFILNHLPVKPGGVNVTSNSQIEWDAARHVEAVKRYWIFKAKKTYGGIVFGDGSVQTVTSSGLTNLFQQTGLATNRLAIP